MRDTVVSILLTQVPIAVGCIWVAWEMRGIRKALERITDIARRLEDKQK